MSGVNPGRLQANKAGLDRQHSQQNHNKPRVGFAHTCYDGSWGTFFQRTVKNGVIERLINMAHEGMIKYRLNGNKKAFKHGFRHPEEVFVYDDPMFEEIDGFLDKAVRRHIRDYEGNRKQVILRKIVDCALTIMFEDIFYRARFKVAIKEFILYFYDRLYLFDLDEYELKNMKVQSLDTDPTYMSHRGNPDKDNEVGKNDAYFWEALEPYPWEVKP
jgi:hypothetical protein